jgi:prepilin-type N-terminal cleavage/methylation domain-containing protein/prepilin-type processing-associated H-X9-DG protein
MLHPPILLTSGVPTPGPTKPAAFTMRLTRSTPVSRSPRQHRAGFTLIELLTVIAIIGILAAILIPTVSKVRSSARQATCASNMRQIAMAVLMYSQDNQDWLPASRVGTGWRGLFRGIQNPEFNTQTPSDPTEVASSQHISTHIGAYLSTGKQGTLWRCPGNQDGAAASLRENSAIEITYLLNSNRAAGTDRNFPFGGNGLRPSRLSEVRAAAGPTNAGKMADGRLWKDVTERGHIWMVSDADSINYGGFSGYPSATSLSAVPMPHNGGRNYAFFDGRVAYFKANNLPANP